ncbi:MAG TPA: hypothetical protein VIV60_26185 [Polyangiaceae bacterium]
MIRSSGQRFVPLLVVAQSLWCGSMAHAQTAADRETARLLMDQGDEQVERGALEAALALYLGSHELMHVPTTGIEVARTYHALGRLVEARDSALEVLRMPSSSNEPQPFTDARAAAAQLAAELEQLIPILTVEIAPAAAAAHATLSIDGATVPKAARDLSHALNPTTHSILASAPGYYDVEQHITLERQERRQLRLDLRPFGKVSASFTHTRDGNAPAIDQAHASDHATRWRWPLWAGVGVGGAGLVVGAIAGAFSLDRASAAKRYCNGNVCTPSAQSDRDAASSAARISNIGFAVGALGAVVAIGSWWLSTRPAPDSGASVRLTLMAAQNAGMLHVSGEAW